MRMHECVCACHLSCWQSCDRFCLRCPSPPVSTEPVAPCLQVVPTVGVEGSDAERAREKMQAHFRLLGEILVPRLYRCRS